MPLTPEQQAKIRNKEASLPDALKRDALIDYKEGYFFVTLNTRGEAPILSIVRGRIGGEGKDAPHCEYTALGRRVKEAWDRNPAIYPYVEIIACEVMPEHFHGLLRLKPGNRKHLGEIIKGFMIGCSHGYWDTLGIDWRSMTYTKGVRTPEYEDRDHTRSLRGPALFVRGYNDTEPVTPEEVATKIEYISKQAERRLIKGQNHECFHIHRGQHSHNWTPAVIAAAIRNDRFFAHNPQRCTEATAIIMARIAAHPQRPYGSTTPSTTDNAVPTLDFLGNKSIMAAARKLPLICHRADAARFEELQAATMKAAREGAVIVSAFISPKEREIREQLLRELLPFVEIMDNGFAERYKPGGRAFYACGEMRMVQITPWTYEYQKDTAVSREMCLVMNELARVISGEKDDWWKA